MRHPPTRSEETSVRFLSRADQAREPSGSADSVSLFDHGAHAISSMLAPGERTAPLQARGNATLGQTPW
jgi:hypothetical protein